MYEIMRYWDEDLSRNGMQSNAIRGGLAAPTEMVVSRLLKSVGPNARLVEDDWRRRSASLKAELVGEIGYFCRPDLARSLTELGLIDEYRLYLHPVVLGHGTPYFAGPRPAAPPYGSRSDGEDVMRLAYVPRLISRLAGWKTNRIRFDDRDTGRSGHRSSGECARHRERIHRGGTSEEAR